MNGKLRVLTALALAFVLLGLVMAGCKQAEEEPVARSYQCDVYIEQGCAKMVVADGGEVEVQSGGTLDIQSGATSSFGGDLAVEGSLNWVTDIVSKSASYTLLASESGALVTQPGASAGMTFTLPSAAAGLNYCFYVHAGQIVTIAVGSGDLIHHLTNAADNRINNAGTSGDSVCLTAIDAYAWVPSQEIGTWADTN